MTSEGDHPVAYFKSQSFISFITDKRESSKTEIRLCRRVLTNLDFKKKKSSFALSTLTTLNCTPEIKIRDETPHLRPGLLTEDITPGACNSVLEYKARRKFLKRFINVNSKGLLHGHYCKGLASTVFKAGLWKGAASRLLQEGCRGSWVKTVPKLPGKQHPRPAAAAGGGSVPDGWLAGGSGRPQMDNGIQRHVGELEMKLGSLSGLVRTWGEVFRGIIFFCCK